MRKFISFLFFCLCSECVVGISSRQFLRVACHLKINRNNGWCSVIIAVVGVVFWFSFVWLIIYSAEAYVTTQKNFYSIVRFQYRGLQEQCSPFLYKSLCTFSIRFFSLISSARSHWILWLQDSALFHSHWPKCSLQTKDWHIWILVNCGAKR